MKIDLNLTGMGDWTSLDGGQLYLTTTRTAGAYLTKPPAYIIVHSDGRRIQLTIDDLFDLVETLQSLKKGPGLVTALGHKDRTCLETETNVSYFDGDGNAQYETHCIVYAVKVDKKWTIEEVR